MPRFTLSALVTIPCLLSSGCLGVEWPVDELDRNKAVHFVARDFQGADSVWHTDTILLERSVDPEEGLVFVLDNPTETVHTFVMPDVQRIVRERVLRPEQSVDIPEPIRVAYVEPLIVTINPGERKQVRVHAVDLFARRSVGRAFRYFCSIHKDIHLARPLYVL
ncbi:hypothetical protein [Candidatus Nitrospira bockiana]